MNKKGFPKNKEYYEIRLESIGGLGANLCGKMLGELGVNYLNLNSASFSSYGSEKTGTPVKGYIRFCEKEKEIRVHSPIIQPDLLVIFHQALMQDADIFKGCTENTIVLIAMEEGQDFADEGFAQIKFPAKVAAYYGIPAQKIAMDTRSRINMVMLGAIAGLLQFAELEDVWKICRDTLGQKYPDALEGNLKGIQRGYEEVKKLSIKSNINEHDSKEEKKQRTMPIGGINPWFGNSVAVDVSPSRQGFIPIFIKERCINCGLCDSTCPDMVFQFAKGEYKGREMMVNKGLDYYHCKGCLRCVDVCPVNALVKGLEAEHAEKEYFLPNQDLLKMPAYYQKAGPDGYITSESYLTEKRMDGGEV